MYTRWRMYILAVFLIVIAVCVFCILLFRKITKKQVSFFQGFLFTFGVILVTETLIVSTLSNFNLGVILPAFFGVPMIGMAFLLPYCTQGFLKFFKWFVAGCYALASIIFLVCGILMLSAQHDRKDVKADAVIVLGAAVHGDKVTWVLENRLETAYDYLVENPDAVCVVSGGMGNGENVTEGSAMKKYLMAKGLPEERILLEDKATNTVENFRFSKKILDDRFGTDVRTAFVTTDFHVFRAGCVAKAEGIQAVGIPAPDVWYLRLNNFLRECVGICVYALRGSF